MKKVKILSSHDIDNLREYVEKFLDNPYVELIDVKITTENRINTGNYGSTQVTTDIACIIYEETEHVEINGLLWFVSNFSLNIPEGIGSYGFSRRAYDKKLFYYSELEDLQESNNGRLPTSDEFTALFDLPHIWDKNRMGFWFASKINELMTNKSLFIGAIADDREGESDTAYYHVDDEFEDSIYGVCEIGKENRKFHKLSLRKESCNHAGLSYEDKKCFVRFVRDL